MAPTNTTHCPLSLLSTKDRHKLRKPQVEKMRRDRINGCIEQLKVLLEEEFRRQDPNAKLEKADDSLKRPRCTCSTSTLLPPQDPTSAPPHGHVQAAGKQLPPPTESCGGPGRGSGSEGPGLDQRVWVRGSW
uniref:BHLH domain-containing protein n=1 Tax=Lates calcarifer TaxID=8187 RepID=A0A4W6D557_LATCA